jgi:hypothetical protein
MADPVDFQFICEPFNVIHEYEISIDARLMPAHDLHPRM